MSTVQIIRKYINGLVFRKEELLVLKKINVEMINFCHACLKPVLTSDKVCADDYGVENLQAGQDFWKTQRGFRTERFIVPPVCVTVQFPCKINIANIIIDPVVGRQKSCGFEIFTSQKLSSSWLQGETKNEKTIRKNSSIVDDEVFEMIGKERTTEPVVVCFNNPLYRPRGQFSEFKHDPINVEKRVALWRNKSMCFTSVGSVKIRIVSTIDRSSPALKRLEIWGQPSSSCFTNIQRRVYDLYKAALYPLVSASNTVSGLYEQDSGYNATPKQASCTLGSDSSEISSKNDENDITIPEDFMDPITCDIMTVPLTLPSGKTVDQLTLDKHINAEAMWGRPPSDMFTGVPFNDSKKPVTNVPLKVRIDQFVLINSSKLKTIPRVLGRAARANKYNPQGLSIVSATTTSINQNGMAKGRALKRKFHHTQSDELTDVREKKMVKNTPCRLNGTANKMFGNHESNLTESLDAALFATLGNLPSFQSVQPTVHTDCVKNSSSKSSLCINCQVSGGHNPNLYKLLCAHVICKKCLTKLLVGSNGGKCTACSKKFMSKDVTRFNV